VATTTAVKTATSPGSSQSFFSTVDRLIDNYGSVN
jgi:hypothetical protein